MKGSNVLAFSGITTDRSETLAPRTLLYDRHLAAGVGRQTSSARQASFFPEKDTSETALALASAAAFTDMLIERRISVALFRVLTTFIVVDGMTTSLALLRAGEVRGGRC